MSAASAREPLPPPTAEADEVRRAADEILSRPEFQEPTRSLYQQFLDWLGDLLNEVLGALIGSGTGSFLAWGFLLAVVASAAFLVVRAVRGNARAPGGVPGDGDTVLLDPRRPAEAWTADAEHFETEGRWRDALRCRYRALVATLARTGVIEEVPGRTTGEYQSLVRHARPTVAEPFAGATELFERAWYGNAETGPEETSAFRDLADRVTTAPPR